MTGGQALHGRLVSFSWKACELLVGDVYASRGRRAGFTCTSCRLHVHVVQASRARRVSFTFTTIKLILHGGQTLLDHRSNYSRTSGKDFQVLRILHSPASFVKQNLAFCQIIRSCKLIFIQNANLQWCAKLSFLFYKLISFPNSLYCPIYKFSRSGNLQGAPIKLNFVKNLCAPD